MKTISQFAKMKKTQKGETSMSIEVYMPRLGATMKKGDLVRWLKKEGDAVKKGEVIAEIASDKLSSDIEAPDDGFLDKIVVQEGETVPVGSVLGIISESNSNSDIKSDQEIKVSMEDHQGPKTILEEKPVSNIRKIIGERMAESLRISPQGTMTTRADMTELIAFKDKLASDGKKVSFTDLFVKIAGLALEKNPLLNASIVNGKLVLYKSVNIGVGVGSEDGLYVTVIKNVEQKSLLQISSELKELILKVKEKRISIDDMTGGTFTISNLGMFDVDVITPILNPPEAAILAIGSTRKEAVVSDDDQIVVRPIVTLSLTADHAVMDGIDVMNFFRDLKEIMKMPEKFLSN